MLKTSLFAYLPSVKSLKKNYSSMRTFALIVLFIFTSNFIRASQTDETVAKRNLIFVENIGQLLSTDLKPVPFVKYYSKTKNLNLYFANNEIYYVFEKPIYKKGDFQNPDDEFSPSNIEKIETNTIKLKLIGANPNAIIEASDKTQYFENFYLSHCPNGILNVNTYKKIIVKDVYKGIDWILYYDKENNLKYDFYVHENADPHQIKIEYSGQETPFIDNEGNLIVKNSFGEIKEVPPVLYQNNQRIDSKWLIADDYITIDLSSVNNNLPLTIDPQVFWSTRLQHPGRYLQP